MKPPAAVSHDQYQKVKLTWPKNIQQLLLQQKYLYVRTMWIIEKMHNKFKRAQLFKNILMFLLYIYFIQQKKAHNNHKILK